MNGQPTLKHHLVGIMALGIAAFAVSFCSSRAIAQTTVTYTDPVTEEPTNTVVAPPGWDGRVQFRVQSNPVVTPQQVATASVDVIDDTGQMAPMCIPMGPGVTVDATSEPLVAAPMVTLRGLAYPVDDCTGTASIPSNPIEVRFAPEPSRFLEPSPPSP